MLKSSYIGLAFLSFLLSIIFVFHALPSFSRPPSSIVSPNGKYEATLIQIGSKGLHYQIKNRDTGRVIFSTREQRGRTQNDVKAGRFSSDSTQFGAAYHYGHKGRYTWIGVWSVTNGVRRKGKEISGFVRDIPNSIFDNLQGVWWTLGCYCEDGYNYNTIAIKSCMAHQGAAGLSCSSLANRIGRRVKCQLRQINRNYDGSACDPQPWNFQIISK
ncbi:MAG: hypothetical protein WBA93_26895 [Microcoleaceae cyanobacterium]